MGGGGGRLRIRVVVQRPSRHRPQAQLRASIDIAVEAMKAGSGEMQGRGVWTCDGFEPHTCSTVSRLATPFVV